MYSLTDIEKIIAETPQEYKGEPIDRFYGRLLAVGRKMNKETRNWYMVYVLFGKTDQHKIVASKGIIL